MQEISIGALPHLKSGFMQMTVWKNNRIVLDEIRQGNHESSEDMVRQTGEVFKQLKDLMQKSMKARFAFSEEDYLLIKPHVSEWLKDFEYAGIVEVEV